jgi:hypothetical protein
MCLTLNAVMIDLAGRLRFIHQRGVCLVRVVEVACDMLTKMVARSEVRRGNDDAA